MAVTGAGAGIAVEATVAIFLLSILASTTNYILALCSTAVSLSYVSLYARNRFTQPAPRGLALSIVEF